MRLMTLILLLMPSTRLVPRGQRPAAVRLDARQVSFNVASKGLEWGNVTVHGTAVPLLPEAFGVAAVAVGPERLEVVLHHVDDEQGAVVGKQLS